MKNKKLKIIKNLGLGILIFGVISLFASAPANAVVSPAKSVINPATETVYVPDNDSTPGVRVYIRDGRPDATSYWTEADGNYRIDLNAGEKCRGLAVWQEQGQEGRLLISVSGTSKSLRYYKLTTAGLPDGSPKDVALPATSSPAGVAIISLGNRAYLADSNNGRIYSFFYNQNTDSWDQAPDYIQAEYGVYDIALTPVNSAAFAMTYKIFASVKNTGKILAYDYFWSLFGGETTTPLGATAGLEQPTYLQTNASGSKLYASVNGIAGGDVKIYDIISTAPGLDNPQTVNSIPNAYAWTGLAVSLDESHLYFTQAQNIQGWPTKVYDVGLPLAGNLTVDDTYRVHENDINREFDGLVVNQQFSKLAATYSGDGSLYELPTGTLNQPPTVTDMGQYLLDGTTEIPKAGQGEQGGTTIENQIRVKFTVSDPENQPLTYTIFYKRSNTTSWITGATGSANSGEIVDRVIPDNGTFENGGYDWRVRVEDPIGYPDPSGYYEPDYMGDTGTGNEDFFVDHVNFYVVSTSPDDGDTGVPINAPVVVKFNRQVDLNAPFSMTISPNINWNLSWCQGDSRVTAVHENDLFVTGQEYTVTVTAQDMQGHSLPGGSYTFSFTAGDTECVYITDTRPVDGETNVALNRDIRITFSRSVDLGTFAYDCQPGITGVPPLSGILNQAVLSHDNFLPQTLYTFNVTDAVGENGEALWPGPVPNPFEFETGTETQDDCVLDLTVLMQGFFDGTTQVVTGVEIELRDTLTNAVGTWYNTLNSNGNAQIVLSGLTDGDYYIVVRHDLPNTSPGPNHLAIMTESTVGFTSGSTTVVNLSDTASPNYEVAYNSDPGVNPDPMFDDPSGMKVMRGGDGDGDGLVGVLDFAIFGAANGAIPTSPNWDERADFDGDGLIGVLDFAIFGQNNGLISYVP